MTEVVQDTQLSVTDMPEVVPMDRASAGLPLSEVNPELYAALFQGKARTYVILDAAKITRLFGLLDAEDIGAVCLFTGEAEENYGNVAPWIAEVKGDERLLRLLFSKTPDISALWPSSAAVFVRAHATLDEVRSHFRRHTKVPRANGADLFFRFWDPEVAHFYYDGVADWPERIYSLCVSSHAVIHTIIAPKAEDESVRIFDLQNPPTEKISGPPLRLEERDLQVLGEMQWPKLEKELIDWLPRADPVRFRGFSKERRQVLASHAVKEGRAFGLTFKEEYAYFLYMMTFLGGWFHTAPQFGHFTRLLSVPEATRYIDLRRDFPRVYAKRFGHMGKPSEVMPYLQSRISTCLRDSGGWSGLTNNHVASINQEIEARLGWKDTEVAIVRADADGKADETGLTTALAKETHYLLWLLIGPHFLVDPLFPWAGEIFEAGESPDTAILAVAQFGVRRLNRTLSIQRILTRAKV